MPIQKGIKIIAENRKAFHDYFIDERFEAGIALSGTEVKSLRAGKVNLRDSYCQVKDGEMYLIGVHISPYEQGNRFNLDPDRTRKLLMHKKEIIRLYSKTKEDGENWHKKHSKAHDFVDEMFHSEVITDIIEQQDKPGAVNNKVESSNMDVAD